jgi:hypothetical protein
MVATALEGEVNTTPDGLSSTELSNWFKRAVTSYHKFLTYGWYSDGASWEGMGKNYIFGQHLLSLARRGYDYFGHPHLQKYGGRFITTMMQPYGYSFISYDVLGGTGTASEEKGKLFFNTGDYAALKWMLPNDPSVDFAWRNFVYSEYKGQVFLDLRDGKFGLRSGYANNLLPTAIYAIDPNPTTANWTTLNSNALGALDFIDPQGGTMVARSSYDPDATLFLMHTRQDYGGHTNADRNTFVLSALGRIFVNYNTSGNGGAELQNPDFHSIITVDNLSMYVTQADGHKMRIPSKMAAWTSGNADASFMTGDATYAYSNQWKWSSYLPGNPPVPTGGFAVENHTLNDFRHTGYKIPEAYGNTAFFNSAHWINPGQFEGIQFKSYNPMRQVYRTSGLIRGAKPYVLMVDDVRKDDATHDYKWLASIAKDLTILNGTSLPAGCNPATDVVLQEPVATGNRRLLVRIVQANGTPVQATGSTGSSLAYVETLTDAVAGTHNRLVIERSNTVAPDYRVVMMPFRDSDALPTTTYSNNVLTMTVGTQVDTITFYPRTATVAGQTVTMNEFTLVRNGSTLLDYRTNAIEPANFR